MSSLIKRTYPELFLPGQWVEGQKKQQTRAMFQSWRAGIPPNYFLRFVKLGLQPFLRKYGYSIQQNYTWCAKYVASWLFSHVQMNRMKHKGLKRTFMECTNSGGEEEMNEFLFAIPFDDWEAFADQWKCSECLDDSPTGLDQRLDLPSFAWNLVELEASRAYHKWIDTMKYMDGNDDEPVYVSATHQEDTAFGGDRRTH